MNTVLVTGANRGLGLRFAQRYAEDGWRVYACCRSVSPELAALEDRHDQLQVEELDVTAADSVAALAQKLAGQPIDLLLNNAGTYGRYSFTDGGIEHQAFGNTDFANWEQVMQVNVFGPMRMVEAFVDNVACSQQKKIITLSSMLGSMGLNTIGGMYAYRTSKAAVNMMMHSMGIDLAKQGILACAVHPGWARTDMGGPDAEISPEEGVDGLMHVIAELDESKLGRLNAYDGSVLPY